MNLRALTRGDAAVAGAAVLLFIASFLPYVSISGCALDVCSSSAWSADYFPVLPSIFLLGMIAAGLILAQRFQGEAAAGRQILGLRLDQWGIALSVAALWTSVWGLASTASKGFGAWLGLLSLLVLAGAAAAGPLVPALQAPLLSDTPATPQGYAPYAGPGSTQGGQGQPGYGYPGVAQTTPLGQGGPLGQTTPLGQGGPLGQTTPLGQGGPLGQTTTPLGRPGAMQQGSPYGTQHPQPGGYGFPPAVHDQVPDPTQALPPVQAGPVAPAAPAAPFAPYWFAVPAVRPLASKDNPAGPAVGELVPGTWYLAVGEQGSSLVAQLQDGTQGLLTDTIGIQRG